jgi:hypothetical protein
MVTHSLPESIAGAANQASVTRLPRAPAAMQRFSESSQCRAPGEIDARLDCARESGKWHRPWRGCCRAACLFYQRLEGLSVILRAPFCLDRSDGFMRMGVRICLDRS